MSSTLEKRGKAFESKFFHDEEMKFRLISRRRKLLGIWAAQKMHLEEEETLLYAIELVKFGVANPGDSAITEKLLSDLKEAGLEYSEDDIAEKREKFQAIAEHQLEKEYSPTEEED